MVTMVGWKRIVVTVGEKIGKSHLTYAQGASAEIVAMATIGLADLYGLPVSTTHVVTGAIAGVGSIQRVRAVRWSVASYIVVAWILTIPAAALASAIAFMIIRTFQPRA